MPTPADTREFQYNCLCRFEYFTFSNKRRGRNISIQLFVSVRVYAQESEDTSCQISIQLFVSVRVDTDMFPQGTLPFQYNCLCRFEIDGNRFRFWQDNFNTTVCVGSRNLWNNQKHRLTDFNTTVCVGSSFASTAKVQIAIRFQYNCLCRFENVK